MLPICIVLYFNASDIGCFSYEILHVTNIIIKLNHKFISKISLIKEFEVFIISKLYVCR